MRNLVTPLVMLGVLALGAAACSSESDSSGGSGASGASGASGSGGSSGGSSGCNFTDLCSKVTFAFANTTCGMNATASTPIDAPGSAPGPLQSSICRLQDGTNEVGGLNRYCFASASDANLFFQADHDKTLSPMETQTDLTGVGDKAYYREAPSIETASVHVIEGSLIAVASDNATGGVNKQACLVTLAEAILAAK